MDKDELDAAFEVLLEALEEYKEEGHLFEVEDEYAWLDEYPEEDEEGE